MRSFLALIRREWLEHKVGFVVAPAVVALCVMLVGLTLVPNAHEIRVEVAQGQSDRIALQSDASLGHLVANMLLDVSGSTDTELQLRMSYLLQVIALPFYWVLLTVSIFVVSGSLYDERRDRSILFWRSMPVSDPAAIGTKLLFVAYVAPLATWLAVMLVQVVAVALFASFAEEGLGTRIWMQSDLLGAWGRLAFGFLSYGLVMSPLFAWLLLVSSWARKSPMLFVLVVPILLVVLERVFFGSDRVGSFIGWVLQMPCLPRGELVGQFPNYSVSATSLNDQLGVLVSGHFWVGLALAIVLLVLTVHSRQRNTTI